MLIAVVVFLLLTINSAYAENGWTNINGTVTYDGLPVCSMVLANGQYEFSCSGDGGFDFDVPLDGNGQVTIQTFCSGHVPFRKTLDANQTSNLIIELTDSDTNETLDVNPKIQIADNNRCTLTGTVTWNDMPLCSMVLANGQYMFSCGANDGTFDLDVPMDAEGNITLYCFCAGMSPYKKIISTDDLIDSLSVSLIYSSSGSEIEGVHLEWAGYAHQYIVYYRFSETSNWYELARVGSSSFDLIGTHTNNAYDFAVALPGQPPMSGEYLIGWEISDARSINDIEISPLAANPDWLSSVQFSAQAIYSDDSTEDITNQVTWKSSDTSVATIDSNGLAEAIGPGSTTISATFGSFSASTTLSVDALDPKEMITKTPDSSIVNINGYVQAGSQFSLEIQNKSDVTFEIYKAEFRNGGELVTATSDLDLLSDGTFSTGETIYLRVTLSRDYYDNGFQFIYYLRDTSTNDDFVVDYTWGGQ